MTFDERKDSLVTLMRHLDAIPDRGMNYMLGLLQDVVTPDLNHDLGMHWVDAECANRPWTCDLSVDFDAYTDPQPPTPDYVITIRRTGATA